MFIFEETVHQQEIIKYFLEICVKLQNLHVFSSKTTANFIINICVSILESYLGTGNKQLKEKMFRREKICFVKFNFNK